MKLLLVIGALAGARDCGIAFRQNAGADRTRRAARSRNDQRRRRVRSHPYATPLRAALEEPLPVGRGRVNRRWSSGFLHANSHFGP